jgi:transcriptional regulator with XRE-family HTH domain
MDRDGLADFLRRRRQALTPEDVGLGPGRRRRTAGLRREEVAALAHMSTDFYARLEQRRGSRPSEQTVAALARALRLTQDERDHLFQLAGHVAPPRGYRTDHVSPALMRVLDRLDTPAQVVSDLGVILRQNPLAEALMGVQTNHSGLARSVFYRWFTDPEERRRSLEADYPEHSRSYVATLRAAYSRDPDDPEAKALVAALLKASPEFAELWERHEVAVRRNTRKRFDHPAVGLLELDCQILTSENQMERLVVFTATPGTQDAERLEMLGVIGTFEPAVG